MLSIQSTVYWKAARKVTYDWVHAMVDGGGVITPLLGEVVRHLLKRPS